MIRGLLYWSGGLLLTLLLALPFYLLVPLYGKYPDMPHLIISFWARLLVRVFYGSDIKVKGKENISPGQNYIIVSNHRSYTDILFAHASLPIQFRWLAKDSLFRIPLIGLAMKIAGYIAIERARYISASRSLETVKEVLRRGRSVWIFPEGTRTPKEELGRFKRGAFLIAQETGVPILPVVLVNTDKIFVRPCVIRPKTVKVIVLRPLSYSDFRKPGTSEREAMALLSVRIREKIQSQYNSHVT